MNSHETPGDEIQEEASVKSGRRHKDEPGAAGHPTPGSGHDDSELVTVDKGPPVARVDGVPGATGVRERKDTR